METQATTKCAGVQHEHQNRCYPERRDGRTPDGLCGEWCARYVDLVRTGDAATVLGPKGWTAEKTYWPIPANQLDDLPDLKLEPIDGIAE